MLDGVITQSQNQNKKKIIMSAVHQVLVLCSSWVPEKAGVKKEVNKELYSHTK